MRAFAGRTAFGVAFVTLLALVPPSAWARPVDARTALVGFDTWVETERAKWNVPGVSVAVVRGDEVLLARGWGLRDREQRLPVPGKTVFAIGSCTKAFTTLVMATLVDGGKLEWRKPVRTWMPDFALPHEERDDRVQRLEFRDITEIGPAGSINASIEDLATWMRVHLNGGQLGDKKVLEASSIANLRTPVMETGRRISPLDPAVVPGGYALGWSTDTYRGHRRVQHGGAIDGFVAVVALAPQQQVGVAVLVNLDGSGFPDVVVRHVLDRLLGLAPKDWSAERLARKKQGRDVEKEGQAKKATARREGTKPAHALAEYAGTYEHPSYGVLEVSESGGALAMTYNSIETPLEHWHYEVWNGRKLEGEKADNTFEDMRLLFRTGFSGQVEAVEAPFEPAVASIVFTRKGDPRLSDPAYLARFAGTYVLGTSKLAFFVQGTELVLEVNGQRQPQLVPERDDRFTLNGGSGDSITFVSDPGGKVTELKLVQPDGVYLAKRAE